MNPKRIIIGVTGASGTVYAVRLLEELKRLKVETHLIVSDSGKMAAGYELSMTMSDVKALADHVHDYKDIASSLASGSFKTMGMIVAPCSMKTLAEVAVGLSGNLISRAADVVLKERRRLVLMTRETPLTAIHIKNMLSVTECGGIIFPPVPAFYNKPESIDDMVNDHVGRVLDLFDLDSSLAKRWKSE